MEVIKVSDVEPVDKSADTLFRGHVTIQSLTGGQPGEAKEGLRASMVNFSPGAGTVFHIHHTSPQILYVTKGIGRVATEKEEIIVTPGTIIVFPPGEKHLHGATKDSEFSHISIQIAGGKTTW